LNTRADATYRRLRGDILTGRLSAGSRLPFPDLSERYGVSVGTFREALPRLVEQGLVVYQPQIGFRVMTPSVEDLRHLTEARVAIETMALQQSVRDGDLAWESNLLAAHHTLARTPWHLEKRQINDAWLEAHLTFHRVLLQGCPNRRLTGIADLLRDSAEIYRWWHARPEPYNRDIASEHREILDAALARDADAAATALTKHLELNEELHLMAHGEDIDAAHD
jgi:DNA-binding GntR family transcriptional regulator